MNMQIDPSTLTRHRHEVERLRTLRRGGPTPVRNVDAYYASEVAKSDDTRRPSQTTEKTISDNGEDHLRQPCLMGIGIGRTEVLPEGKNHRRPASTSPASTSPASEGAPLTHYFGQLSGSEMRLAGPTAATLFALRRVSIENQGRRVVMSARIRRIASVDSAKTARRALYRLSKHGFLTVEPGGASGSPVTVVLTPWDDRRCPAAISPATLPEDLPADAEIPVPFYTPDGGLNPLAFAVERDYLPPRKPARLGDFSWRINLRELAAIPATPPAFRLLLALRARSTVLRDLTVRCSRAVYLAANLADRPLRSRAIDRLEAEGLARRSPHGVGPGQVTEVTIVPWVGCWTWGRHKAAPISFKDKLPPPNKFRRSITSGAITTTVHWRWRKRKS